MAGGRVAKCSRAIRLALSCPSTPSQRPHVSKRSFDEVCGDWASLAPTAGGASVLRVPSAGLLPARRPRRDPKRAWASAAHLEGLLHCRKQAYAGET